MRQASGLTSAPQLSQKRPDSPAHSTSADTRAPAASRNSGSNRHPCGRPDGKQDKSVLSLHPSTSRIHHIVGAVPLCPPPSCPSRSVPFALRALRASCSSRFVLFVSLRVIVFQTPLARTHLKVPCQDARHFTLRQAPGLDLSLPLSAICRGFPPQTVTTVDISNPASPTTSAPATPCRHPPPRLPPGHPHQRSRARALPHPGQTQPPAPALPPQY